VYKDGYETLEKLLSWFKDLMMTLLMNVLKFVQQFL